MSSENGVVDVRLEVDASGSGVLWLLVVKMANDQEILVWTSGVDPWDPDDLFDHLVIWSGELIGVKLSPSETKRYARAAREMNYPRFVKRGLRAVRWAEAQLHTLAERYPDGLPSLRSRVGFLGLLGDHGNDQRS